MMTRIHRRKGIAELAVETAAIKSGVTAPADRIPNRSSSRYNARMAAWRVPCPKCGAAAEQSCLTAREGGVRWAFHQERWGNSRDR
ncbi:zinc finger domain-containing protein [Sphingomonas sp. Leaf242]|uniref:zinc finger domain-containing protein n=1 Tax=Sphingomonas sp. Leaf242 TaxID=1736304 RepID=UPI003FA76848